MQYALGLRGHARYPERQMEASEHQKGPRNQPQLDQFWIGEMAAHLRHKRRVEGCGCLGQPGREREGRVLLGSARRRARELRYHRLIESLRLRRRLAGVLSPLARIQRRDLQTYELFECTGQRPAIFEWAVELEKHLEGLRAVAIDAKHLIARGQGHCP